MNAPVDLTARPGNFGPDASRTDEKPSFEESAPSAAAQKAKAVLGSLGDNTKTRSSIRQLTMDDHAWIQNKYLTIARMAKPFHPNFADAMEVQSELCANSWVNVARKNDKVRRQILAAIEGGAWGELLVSHGPILMALLPERFLNRILEQSMDLFGAFLNRTSGDEA